MAVIEVARIEGRSAVTRRSFLLGLGAASVLAATACQPTPIPSVPVGTGGSGSTSTPTTAAPSPTTTAAAVPSDPFVRAAWSPLVGQTVTLVGAAGSVAAVLDGIEDLGPTPGHERSFALRFRGAPGQSRLEVVDRVQSAAVGTRAIGATPTDRGRDHQWYQAIVFNPSA